MKKRHTCIADSLCLCITLRCNLRCRHCFLQASPDRSEEMAEEDLVRIIKTCGQSVRSLYFSGGEPTVTLDLLRSALMCASALRRRAAWPREIIVQTNAAWATDLHAASSMLTSLASWGATGIDIGASDIYHWEQTGIEAPALALTLARSMGIFSFVKLSGKSQRIGPRRLGRAKHMRLDETAKMEPCKMMLSELHYVADVEGRLYPCSFLLCSGPNLGSLLRRPLVALIADEGDLGWPVLLRQGGPDLLSRELRERTGHHYERRTCESKCQFCGRLARAWSETTGRNVGHGEDTCTDNL